MYIKQIYISIHNLDIILIRELAYASHFPEDPIRKYFFSVLEYTSTLVH